MRRALPILLGAMFVACGGSGKPVGTSNDAVHVHGHAPPHPEMPVASHLLATVSDGTLGPFLARSHEPGGKAIAAYASRLPEGGRQIVVAPLDEHAVLRTPPHLVASTTGEVDALIARAVSGGFVLAWSVPVENAGGALRLIEVDSAGIARGDAFDVARGDREIVWFEIVPTSRGALCVWAEQTSKTDASIFALSLDDKGKPRGVPSQVVRNVVGWQAVATARGGALALRTASGALSIQEIDADAQPLGAATPVVAKGAGVDFDFVRVESAGKKPAFAFAWTDHSGLDSTVVSCWVEDGSPSPAPVVISEEVGGASFASLNVASGAVFVAWEEMGRRLAGGRRLHITSISSAGVAKTTALDVHGPASEIASDGSGIALVASVRSCALNISDDACGAVQPAPAVTRFDSNLEITGVSPISVPEGETAALAWGLDCTSLGCASLVASNESPTPIFAFDASAEKIKNRLAPGPRLAPGAPRIESLSTISAKEPTSDFAESRIGNVTLIATMNGSEEDAQPQAKSSSATVEVRTIDEKTGVSAPIVLTTHALDLGGVAIATSDAPENGALVAWVAIEGGDPQVHAARIDAHGKKLHELSVTRELGEAADVAVAWCAGAWLVAWVDWRDGNGEVYAARVAPDASRVLATERITRAPGDASGVVLLAPPKSQEAWLAWADPRENPKEGFADIYVTKIRGKDAKKAADETRVLATAAHSRSPALAALDDGVALGWIEEAPLGEGGSDAHYGTTTASYGAMLARLDAKGHVVGEPVRTRGAGPGFPSAIALASEGRALRAVTARSQEDALVLDVLDWSPGQDVRSFALTRLEGPPSMDVALALDADTIYFDDEDNSAPGDRRLRRLVFAPRP
jgi:hypothetical protein